jgi:hypothetical protein
MAIDKLIGVPIALAGLGGLSTSLGLFQIDAATGWSLAEKGTSAIAIIFLLGAIAYLLYQKNGKLETDKAETTTDLEEEIRKDRDARLLECEKSCDRTLQSKNEFIADLQKEREFWRTKAETQ